MRLETELRAASGYTGRPRDFDDLIHILDPELRLITPTDPEGATGEAQTARPGGARCYQLTHDYLVHSLRDWLTRKQRETRRGRAQLQLAERAALWDAKPENRRLPSVLEWANIRLLTKKEEWTDQERRMMRRAGPVHGLRGLGLAVLIALASWGGIEGYGSLRASALVESLKTASTTRVPALIEQLRSYRRWAGRPLSGLLSSTKGDSDPHLRASLASLALLPDDDRQVTYVHDHLLSAAPVDLPVIWEILQRSHPRIDQRLWSLLDDPQADPEKRFRAACALAATGSDQVEERWDSVAPFITDGLLTAVIKNPGDYAPLIETLRPVRKRLLTPLASILRDSPRSESQRSFAATILADYASDNPGLLAELLMVADPKAYASLFPVAERHAARVLVVFQAELARKAASAWNDPPIDPSWTKPEPSLVGRIEAAQGAVAGRFAFCQALPIEEFAATAEGLRKSGYRPVRFRPFAQGQAVQVAAVWTRDGRTSRMASGLTADEVRGLDERNRQDTFIPVDVAGYVVTGNDDKLADRFAAIWVERAGPDDDARIYVAATETGQSVQGQLKEAKLIPRTLQAMRGSDGRTRYSGVWGRFPAGEPARHLHWDQSEGSFQQHESRESYHSLVDVTVSGAEPPQAPRQRAQASLEASEKSLKAKPDDQNARLARATALMELGENRTALDDLRVVIEKAPQLATARRCRAMAHARLGRTKEALADVAEFQKGSSTESSKLYLAAVVAAELDEGRDEALARLEAALKKQPHDSGLAYDAACAYALAAKAVDRRNKSRGAALAERAVHRLQAAMASGYSDYDHIQEDSDLDRIRDLPAFAELMKAGHLDRRYASVWSRDPTDEALPIYGLDPAGHLEKCRALIAEGYRPVSVSLARSSPQGPLVTASVWHRPAVSEEARDYLAGRQVRAAASLIRLGQAGEVWPLLRHSSDPRLRSFIVNWLCLLGADPNTVAAELARLDSLPRPAERGAGGTPLVGSGRRPGEGSSAPATAMNAILFDTETSTRRALILALGRYGRDGLSPSEREPFLVRLLDLYEHDPDAGIHGAAEWTLRQWQQQARVDEIDAMLRGKDKGARRWYVNDQGQTFALIKGPVEFRMGSPPDEPDRDADETPHRRAISHDFAIAVKEVTVAQYQQFVKETPEFGLAQNLLDKYSPDPDGPMIEVSWFGAAAYCNWLSKQEGLAEDQWCYVRNERQEYSGGMRIPADVLKRNGYRLPSEAEWEYACRAGSITSRYHGVSIGLLGAYARYAGSSQEHAWRCGSLLPNDLGLFDMLGNVYEWCLERHASYQPGRTESPSDDFIDDLPRLLRGAGFFNLTASVRSAHRLRHAPASRSTYYGLRLSRTYN
jgi:formylglycine-generating enzyme required for sulfatase activity/tetratricopeptide (TPR) repeat protein